MIPQDMSNVQSREWSADRLLTAEFPPMVEVISGMLPEGLALLSGKPNVGKSWLALQIARSVGSGATLFDQQCAQGSAIYYALEDSPRRIQSRLKIQQWQTGTPVVFRFRNQIDRLGSKGTAFNQLCSDMESHRLVIVDTLGKILPSGAKTDDYAYMVDLLGPLQERALECHCCLLFIGHNRKLVSDDGIDNPVGSIGIVATVDTIWQLSKQPVTKAMTLTLAGRDIGARELFVSWDTARCSWNLADALSGKVRPDSEQATVAQALKKRGTATVAMLVADTGMKQGNVSRTIGQLEDCKIATRLIQPGREHWYAYVP